ncbi:MAG: inositol monophosphatase family protein [Phycisphaerales bacterium]
MPDPTPAPVPALDDPELAARTALLRELAPRAGAIAMRWYQHAALPVEQKADASPVTRADKEIEEFLRAQLQGAFPHDGLLGEEFGEAPARGRYTWVIDPIDGTIAFAAGVPLFGVLVGLEERTAAGARIVAGVCEMPALQERVWAARGAGAWWERAGHAPERARVGTRTQLREAFVCTPAADVFARSGSMGSWQRLFEASGRLRGWGDCYAFVLAATGRCDLACDPLMNPWDAGPFPVILEEAGGIYSGWDGAPGIRGTNALAGNPALHAQARAIVWPK